MNLILAGVLLSIGFMLGTSPIRLNAQKFGGQSTAEVTIAEVLPDSSAAKADLKTGDVLTTFSSADEFAKYTRENINRPIIIVVNREGSILTKTILLSDNPDGPLGAGIADVTKVKLPFFKAIAAGFADAYLTTIYIIGLLWGFLTHIFQPGLIAQNVAGPVKIFNITGQVVKMGFAYLVQFAALLSINVALVNILPLPALDGGRAIIIIAEGIARKKIMRVEIENLLHMIGFIIIIALVVAITVREIIALF
jgi:regulator of sigma E protease